VRRGFILVLLAGAVIAEESRLDVAGVVVDASGQPLPGVKVATFWSYLAGKPAPSEPLVTDAQGRFSGTITHWRDFVYLTAYSKDAKLAGQIGLGIKEKSKGLRIVLRPSVRVHGTIVSPRLGRKPPWTNVYVQQGETPFLMVDSHEARIDFRVPLGVFVLYAYGGDIESVTKFVAVTGQKPAIDLGAVSIRAGFLALHKGKRLPAWKVTEARGLPLEKTALENFRGKWLLVEFWGFW
jgi:hypothetical protein